MRICQMRLPMTKTFVERLSDMSRWLLLNFALLALLVLGPFASSTDVHAQTNGQTQSKTKKQNPSSKKQTGVKPNKKTNGLRMPDARRLNLMIRTTVIALNHANQTGNYSVLRDLAAPNFQIANSSARLAEIFSNIRKRKLDLSPILFFDPKLIRDPSIQPNGLLRMSGFFDTRPERVIFDLQFQFIANTWRLFGITLDTRIAEAGAIGQATGAAQNPKAKTKSAPQKNKK